MAEPAPTELRSLLAVDFSWTPRQREVLSLLASKKSNQQIADELGISLDGAKWHMREILSKLNVETREDAAEYWRLYQGWKPRLARSLRSGLPLASVKSAVAVAGMAVIGLVTLAVVVVLSNGDGPPSSGPVDASVEPASSSTAPATSLPSNSTQTVTSEPRTVVLDVEPRPQPQGTTLALGTPPAPVQPPWDGESTVIYDIEQGVLIDLGPGTQPAAFSPDETKAAWISGAPGLPGMEGS